MPNTGNNTFRLTTIPFRPLSLPNMVLQATHIIQHRLYYTPYYLSLLLGKWFIPYCIVYTFNAAGYILKAKANATRILHNEYMSF